jgi:hypothetical protein
VSDLKEVLEAAYEFVNHVANQEKADEWFAQTANFVSAADQHRNEASRIERRDALITRARTFRPYLTEIIAMLSKPKFIPYTPRPNCKDEPGAIARKKHNIPDGYTWCPANEKLAFVAGWEAPKESKST